ncbi:MAG: monovalent cation/H(+) antiporter subunit G [Elusimicrobiota bacterium]
MIGNVLMLAGTLFCLTGCIGLVRLTDFHRRVQSISKSIGLGICLILLGVFANQGFTDMGIRALLCAALIWIALPVCLYAVVRGLHRGKSD